LDGSGVCFQTTHTCAEYDAAQCVLNLGQFSILEFELQIVTIVLSTTLHRKESVHSLTESVFLNPATDIICVLLFQLRMKGTHNLQVIYEVILSFVNRA
jgi:hypothetical protein